MKFFLTILLLGVFHLGHAQNEGAAIDFKEVGFEQAKKMAKESGKLLFCDFSATWCAPCKTLYKNVFSDKEVGELINKNFVSLYINSEAPEWIDIAKEYNVKSYPTMLILSPDGSEKFRLQGSVSKSKFMLEISQFIDDKRSPEMIKSRYNSGERTPQLVYDYAYMQMKNGAETEGFKVINNYFNSLTDAPKADKENSFLYDKFSTGIDDIKVKYLIENYKNFYNSYGKEQTDDMVYKFVRNTLLPYVTGYLVKENQFEQQNFDNLISLIKSLDIGRKEIFNSLINIAKARVKSDLNPKDKCDDYAKVCKKEVPNLDKNNYFITILNVSFMNTKASDRAKLIMIDLIDNYKEKYEKEKPAYDALAKVKRDLKPIKRGDSIDFKDISFKDALAMAKKNDKLIFIDCYTTWCGPCKKLSEEVFTADIVRKFFDKTFINLKIDMEKGEGVDLMKKFNVKGFPTLLLVNSDSEVVFSHLGETTPEELVRIFKEKSV